MSKHKYVRVPREEGELFERFKEQIDFMISGAEQYDRGRWSRIKTSTPAMRTLFYDLSYSKALVKRISIVNQSEFISTNWNEGNEELYTGPVFSTRCADGEVRYFPVCYMDDYPITKLKMPFDQWWEETILSAKGVTFSRHELVQFVANTDGGAHVDDEVFDKYSQLIHDVLSEQWNTAPDVYQLAQGYSYALLRQIIHEAVTSFQHMHFMKIPYSNGKDSQFDSARIKTDPLIQTSFQWLDDDGNPM